MQIFFLKALTVSIFNADRAPSTETVNVKIAFKRNVQECMARPLGGVDKTIKEENLFFLWRRQELENMRAWHSPRLNFGQGLKYT